MNDRRPVAIIAIVVAVCWCFSTPVGAAQGDSATSKLTTGEEIYHAGCAGCHGPGGEGAAETTIGFEKPDTFPDFTRCDQTTVEQDVDWRATIHDGGHGRGFSPIMPSFSEALTPSQIDAVIRYLRSFCRETWPRGELNLPRPLTTEKAFPESETVLTTAVTAHHAPEVTQALVYEHRFGRQNQLEVSIPFGFLRDESGAITGGVDDIGFGLKHVLFSSRNSIVSAQGEVILPTGNRSEGFGTGVTTFEAFAAYGQLLPAHTFVQLQGGTEQPTSTEETPRAVFGRLAVGKSFREENGLGRLWSPMFELVADRDLETGARTNFDVVPQFQVTLSRRQHVRANVGVQIPVTNTSGRSTQVVFYLLWDWFDGGLLEGWR
ncbi:MAG: cytochrome c, class I [Blastocatellia bacterium]|nr:MAG: cytochrome c, class I [Blastocatellia bacterium]